MAEHGEHANESSSDRGGSPSNVGRNNRGSDELITDFETSEQSFLNIRTAGLGMNGRKLDLRRLIKSFMRYVIPTESLLTFGYPVQQILNRRVFELKGRIPNISQMPFYPPWTYIEIFNWSVDSYIVNNNNIFVETYFHRSLYVHEFDKYMSTSLRRNHHCLYHQPDAVERTCARCDKNFFMRISNGEYITKETCYYHWGKLTENGEGATRYTCCGSARGARGCDKGQLHVWDGLLKGQLNGPFNDFVRTRRRPIGQQANLPNKILGLDCEMCYTLKGFEVCKVAIVNVTGELVYSSFIVPECRVIDYNTRFSGVSAKDFSVLNTGPDGIAIRTFRRVQKELLGIIYSDTIVVGHGLENDLRALKLVHRNIVDTALVFPHYYGLPYRRSLKSLAFSYLNRQIQNKSTGHDSNEDAKACIDLMLWKIQRAFR